MKKAISISALAVLVLCLCLRVFLTERTPAGKPALDKAVEVRRKPIVFESAVDLAERIASGWNADDRDIVLIESPEPYDLRQLVNVPELQKLAFDSMHLTVEVLEKLPALERLEFVCFKMCTFEPGALKGLPSFGSLRKLYFTQSRLTHEEFRVVAEKYGPDIEVLGLYGTLLPEESAVDLLRFRNLRRVELGWTMETNRPIDYLLQLQHLEYVSVQLNGPVKKEDADRLKKAIKGVNVAWES